MSKDAGRLKNADVELVGISKLKIDSYRQMNTFMARHLPYNFEMCYESAIIEMSWHQGVRAACLKGLVWCEIDEPSHLQRAKEQVWPKLSAKEKVGVG